MWQRPQRSLVSIIVYHNFTLTHKPETSHPTAHPVPRSPADMLPYFCLFRSFLNELLRTLSLPPEHWRSGQLALSAAMLAGCHRKSSLFPWVRSVLLYLSQPSVRAVNRKVSIDAADWDLMFLRRKDKYFFYLLLSFRLAKSALKQQFNI